MGVKVNAQMEFLGYIQTADGEVVKAKMLKKDVEPPDIPTLTLSGSEDGLYTGKKISGKIELSLDELHDMMNAVHLEGWAVYAVKVTN